MAIRCFRAADGQLERITPDSIWNAYAGWQSWTLPDQDVGIVTVFLHEDLEPASICVTRARLLGGFLEMEETCQRIVQPDRDWDLPAEKADEAVLDYVLEAFPCKVIHELAVALDTPCRRLPKLNLWDPLVLAEKLDVEPGEAAALVEHLLFNDE